MKTAVRWLLYLLGLTVLALGITLNTKTGLGVSPIISVAFCSAQLSGISFGTATFVLYGLFIAAQFPLRPKSQWIATLLQFAVNLISSRMLDLFAGWIPYDAAAHGLPANLLLLAAAILLTGLGVSLSVNMLLVPNPGDGIVEAIAIRIGKDQGFAKNCFDIGCVAVTCVIGLIFGGKIIGIGLGTLLAMLGVGRAVALWNRLLKAGMLRAAGLEQKA